MTRKERRDAVTIVEHAWGRAVQLGCEHHLRKAYDLAAKQERAHRAMGRRWVGAPQAKCLISVDVCAMLFAVRGFVTPAGERSFCDREDFLQGYAAAEACERRASTEGESGFATMLENYMSFYREPIRAIDYSALCGHA